MKKLLLSLLSTLFIFSFALGQADLASKGFAFQGYARDADGAAFGNTDIQVRFSIYEQSKPIAYAEEHATGIKTDAFGVFGAEIGAGTVIAPNVGFNTLDFTDADYWLRVEVRPVAGTYVIISDTKLLSVAYAKAAQTAVVAVNGTLPGTIIAWAGETIPEGYLACDGVPLNAVSNPQYQALYDAIKNAWGGTNNTNFRLPDLGGRFIRGFSSNDTETDPDRGSRVSVNGSNSGNKVGSYQGDQFRNHNHTGNTGNSSLVDNSTLTDISPAPSVYGLISVNGKHTPSNRNDSPDELNVLSSDVIELVNDNGNHSHTIPLQGGNETRPNNAYVYYIIKY